MKPKVFLVGGTQDTPCWWPKRRRTGEPVAPGSRTTVKGPDGKRKAIARVFYEQATGEVPEGKFLHHECQRPCCVNPDHLVAVNHDEHGRAHMELPASVSKSYSWGFTADPFNDEPYKELLAAQSAPVVSDAISERVALLGEKVELLHRRVIELVEGMAA